MVDSVLEVKQIKQLSADGGATVVDVENQTIDGVTIGGTTPAAGTFTTFTSTGIDDKASSTALTIDSSNYFSFGGIAPQTSNGNVGRIYTFDGSNNNPIISAVSSTSNRNLAFEYRRTGRSNVRTAQIGIGENASNQGVVTCYSSTANADVSGGVTLVNGATSWSAISDENKKDIIEPITDGLNKVASLRSVIGKYKTDEEGTRRSFLIAQDFQAVFPEAVSTINDVNGDEALGLSYTDVIPLLVSAIKDLKAEVDSLKQQLGA